MFTKNMLFFASLVFVIASSLHAMSEKEVLRKASLEVHNIISSKSSIDELNKNLIQLSKTYSSSILAKTFASYSEGSMWDPGDQSILHEMMQFDRRHDTGKRIITIISFMAQCFSPYDFWYVMTQPYNDAYSPSRIGNSIIASAIEFGFSSLIPEIVEITQKKLSNHDDLTKFIEETSKKRSKN